MKNFIYTTLLVFATLFCQAFGAQYEPPTLLDTTICAKPGETIQMSKFKPRILELLQNREDSIWSECCDKVMVSLGDISVLVIGDGERENKFSTLPDVNINTKKNVYVDVEYIRELTCSKIPLEQKPNMLPTFLAMWHIFGKLLSKTETEIPDTAIVTTLHKAEIVFTFDLTLPEYPLSQIIQERENCSDNPPAIIKLHLKEHYHPYMVNWDAPKGVEIEKADKKLLISYPNDRYLFPIICTATACKGETRSDTVFIGKPTPKPTMEDISCIAVSANSFVAKVKEADSRLSYHWLFEEEGKTTQSKLGDSVVFEISPSQSGVLQLYSTGGCRPSDTVTQELHRSVAVGNIQLQGDTNCVFIGDTLRFVLQNAPQESLVWKSETGVDTLFGNEEFVCNTTGLNTTSFKVSVSNKYCPESDSHTFNIREDFKVSLGTSPMCISASKDQVIKFASNGINPEVHWYGNGVEIDSTTYSIKDSISLRLVNPGDQNLYVAVTAKECGKKRDTSLVLRPKPEMPSLDTLWNALTPCIPLGIADTIELRVQPQEGVKFKWSIPDIITTPDSNSILVSVNYELTDRGTSILVSVYAYTESCPNSDTLPQILYATGAGLGGEWHIDSRAPSTLRHMVGFCQNTPDEIQRGRIELDTFAFLWTSSVKFSGSDSDQILQFTRPSLPFNVTCFLTNKNTLCYSYYSATIEEATPSQSMVSSLNNNNNIGFGETGGASDMAYMNARPNDNFVDDGIMLTPNPTQGNTWLYLGNANIEGHTVIEIFTEQGVCLYRQTASADRMELPTARFQSGLYFVRIRTGEDEPIVKKFIVK